MENRQNILNELKEISPVVAQVGFDNPYQVPAGYFEGLADQLLQLVRGVEGPAVLPENKTNPYDVPQGYFENFAASVLARIKSNVGQSPKDELESLSPLLSSIGSKQVYEVPAGYFEQLPEQLLQKVKSQPAKTVSMNFTRRMMRYAAAAVVAGLIIAGGWFYFGNSGTGNNSLVGIEKISDEILENYLENQAVNPAETGVLASNGEEEIDSDDLKDLLADVSDEELQKYVDQYGAKDIVN